MGASFRNVGQIFELAGCDLLTISPELMKQLSESHEPVERKLSPEKAKSADVKPLELDEKKFRYLSRAAPTPADFHTTYSKLFYRDVISNGRLS